MKNFNQFIQESYVFDELYDYITEANEVIFPTNGKWAPIRIKVGDHAEERKAERHVTNKEIIDALYKAKGEIKSMLKSGKLKVSHRGEEPMTFVVADTKKDPKYPLSIVGFVSRADERFKQFTIIVKTVARYKDFAALKRPDSENEKHIYLY